MIAFKPVTKDLFLIIFPYYILIKLGKIENNESIKRKITLN